MVTMILLLKRKQGMTPEQFRQHYETGHVALARKHLGHLFVDYRSCYPEETYGHANAGGGDEGYDAITRVDFADRAAYDEFLTICARPDVLAALSEDEARFLDRPAVRISLCEEVRTWTAADL